MSDGKKVLHSMGFDGDGHKRVTQIDKDQTVVGGSAETHDKLVEINMKLRERLKKEGKNLQTAEGERVMDHVREISDQQ